MDTFPGRGFSVPLKNKSLEKSSKLSRGPPAHDGLNDVSASDDRKTEQTRVVPAKPSTALYQDDCDLLTGKILLLSQSEQMNKTASHVRLYGRQTTH